MKNFFKSNKIEKILLIWLVFYIGCETILKSFGLGCKTEGCVATSELLNLSEMNILFLGLTFSIVLFISFLQKNKTLFYFILTGGFIFETIIFSYQLKMNLFCIFCFGVWLTIFILFFITAKQKLNSLLIIGSIIFPIYFLNTQYNHLEEKSFTNKITLLGYYTCPYCKKTKELFEKLNIKYDYINVKKENVGAFFKTIQWNAVPVVVIKEGEDCIRVLKNYENVKQYFTKIEEKETNKIKKEVSNQKIIPNNIFNYQPQQKQEGCSVSKTNNCD